MSERVKGHVSHAHLCMLNWANVYCRESFGKNKLWFFQTLILATGSKCCVGMLVFACQKKTGCLIRQLNKCSGGRRLKGINILWTQVLKRSIIIKLSTTINW